MTFRAKGGSMRPFINGDTDSVTVEAREAYRVGDIVLARPYLPERVVLHRIMSISDDGMRLMGDANYQLMELCRPEMIAGAVSMIHGRNGDTDTSSRSYRFKSGLWRRLHPLRHFLFPVYRIISSIF